MNNAEIVKRARQLLAKTTVSIAHTPTIPVIQPGDTITWLSATGQQTGVVDFLHTDATGTVWAFVTLLDGGWTAVNLKFAKGSA